MPHKFWPDFTASPAVAGSRAQVFLGRLYLVIGFLTPALMLFGVRGFAPVVAIAGLACLPFVRPSPSDWLAFALLAVLIAWAALSAIWSPAPNLHQLHSAKDVQRLTWVHLAMELVLSGALFACASRLGELYAQRALNWLSYGLIIGAALLSLEALSHGAGYQALMQAIGQKIRPDLAVRNLAQGGYVVVTLLWPVSLALRRRGWNGAVVGLAIFIPLSTFLFRGDAPTLALVISTLTFLAVTIGGRVAVLVLMVLTTAYWLLTPLLMIALQQAGVFARLLGHLPASWDHRLRIWSFLSAQFMKHPWRGAGLDATRTFPHVVPLHAHNAALQIWYELGAPGGVLTAAVFAWLFWRIAQAAPTQRLYAATACATASVFLFIGGVSFGVWQEWWICVGALAAAACLLARRVAAKDPDELTPTVPLSIAIAP